MASRRKETKAPTEAEPEQAPKVAKSLPAKWSVSRLSEALEGQREHCKRVVGGIVVAAFDLGDLAPTPETVRKYWGSGTDYKIRLWSAPGIPCGTRPAFGIEDPASPQLPAIWREPPPVVLLPEVRDTTKSIAGFVHDLKSGTLDDDLDRMTKLMGIVKDGAAVEIASVRAAAAAEVAAARDRATQEIAHENARLAAERQREREHTQALSAIQARPSAELEALRVEIRALSDGGGGDDAPKGELPWWVEAVGEFVAKKVFENGGAPKVPG